MPVGNNNSPTQIGTVFGIQVPGGIGINGGNDTDTGYGTANFLSINAIRAKLAAVNGTYFTATQMDKMSYNDLQYALVLAGG